VVYLYLFCNMNHIGSLFLSCFCFADFRCIDDDGCHGVFLTCFTFTLVHFELYSLGWNSKINSIRQMDIYLWAILIKIFWRIMLVIQKIEYYYYCICKQIWIKTILRMINYRMMNYNCKSYRIKNIEWTSNWLWVPVLIKTFWQC